MEVLKNLVTFKHKYLFHTHLFCLKWTWVKEAVPILDIPLSHSRKRYKRVGVNIQWLLRSCSIYMSHLLTFHWPEQVQLGGAVWSSHRRSIIGKRNSKLETYGAHCGGLVIIYQWHHHFGQRTVGLQTFIHWHNLVLRVKNASGFLYNAFLINDKLIFLLIKYQPRKWVLIAKIHFCEL